MSLQLSRIQPRRAKFVPPKPSPWGVSRPRLLERLDDARFFPLTIVSAPAGSGKTTVLSEWVRTLDLPWGWLTIDESDLPFDLLVTNVILALQMANPEIGRDALSFVRLVDDPDPDTVIAELDEDLLGLSGDLILVLDDAHLIRDPRSIDFFQKLLQHPLPGLHLVLSVRRDPDLPLARLRSRGQVVEIPAAELALTQAEAAWLLHNAGIPDDQQQPLIQGSEGWAAGIHLAALAYRYQRNEAGGSRGVGGIVQGDVQEVIIDDILALQSESLQRLLLASSVVDRFTAGLCEALLGPAYAGLDVRAMLHELVADGLLLFSLGGNPEWFRYHQIFREALQQELRRRSTASELCRVHLAASAWYEQAGFVAEAVDHALLAGEQEKAAAIVERNAQRALAEEKWTELAHWLSQLPARLVRENAELTIALAWIHQARGHHADMAAAIDRAEVLIDLERAEHGDDWALARTAELEILRQVTGRLDLEAERVVTSAQAILALGGDRYASGFSIWHLSYGLFYLGEYEQVLLQMEALIEANRGSTDAFARQRDVWARLHLGLYSYIGGDLPRSAELADEIEGLAASFGLSRFISQVWLWKGRMAYERNQLEEAASYFERIIAERSSGIAVLINAHLGLVRVLDALGRWPDGDSVLQEVNKRYERGTGLVYGRALVKAFEAERALYRGDLERSLDWRRSVVDWPMDSEIVAAEYPFLTRIRLHIMLGELEAAERDLRLAEAYAQSPPYRVFYAVRVKAVRALLEYVRGDRQQAMSAMREAVALAAPGGQIRCLLEVGMGCPPFRELLDLMPPGELPFSPREIRRAYDWMNVPEQPVAPVSPPAPASSEPAELNLLTERERDVLEGLMRRLSYKEIALELNISPLTVKSHSTRIYSKLGVASRRQMIRMIERQR